MVRPLAEENKAPQESLLQFPTDYPIKVVGKPSADFRARVHAIFLKHAPDVDPDQVTERLSAQGNFLSVSYVIRATSREQVVALANELIATQGIVMVL